MEGYIQKRFNAVHALVRHDIAAACTDADLAAFVHSLFSGQPSGLLIKKGTYKAIYRCTLAGTPCIVKTYRNKGLAGMLKTVAAASRGRQEFQAASFIHKAGIKTAAPLVLAEKKTLGMVRASAVVLEFIDGAQELRDFFFYDRTMRASERWHVAEEFGCLTARIFRAGVYQYDYALNNFLIRREAGGFALYFIDFERVQLKASVARGQKIDVLARLARAGAEVSLKDRLRFLRGYLAEEPQLAENLHDLAAEMIAATVAAIRHDRARGRLTSIYTHARYERLQQGERTGLYRRGTEVPVLLSAVAALSGRESVGQVVIRYNNTSLAMRAVYFEPEDARDLWAAITALKIAGMTIALPQALVCSEITGCLIVDPSLPAQCHRYFSSRSRNALFVERHFPAEIDLLKSLLAKL